MVEPGKVDEATIHIYRLMVPNTEIEGFCYKVEPLTGMRDALKLLGRE